MDAAPPEGSVLVPAADGRGTNAAFRRPAGLFPLRFGNDSFKPHLEAARATEKPCIVLSLPGIALDVDNPEDLRQLAEAPATPRHNTCCANGISPAPLSRPINNAQPGLSILPVRIAGEIKAWRFPGRKTFSWLEGQPNSAS